jgi:hypothetical protein
MTEARHRPAQRLEDLDLRPGVGDMVGAADHMSDAEIDIVDHRRQRIEISAVLADQDRVALAGLVDMLGPAHHVDPAHLAQIEPETPMRQAPLGFEFRAIGRRQRQRGAVIDRSDPAQIVSDLVGKRGGRALQVGIVEAQQELAGLLARKEPVMQRHEDIADMEMSRRAWCEADANGHRLSGPAGRRW